MRIPRHLRELCILPVLAFLFAGVASAPNTTAFTEPPTVQGYYDTVNTGSPAELRAFRTGRTCRGDRVVLRGRGGGEAVEAAGHAFNGAATHHSWRCEPRNPAAD